MREPCLGIDVSARTFMVSYGPGGQSPYREFSNTPEGITAFLTTLESGDHCVLEATGTYSQKLSLALAESPYAVSVINPRQSRAFAQFHHMITKTDLQDARLLAKMAKEVELPLFQASSEDMRKMKQRRTLLNQLKKQLTALKNLRHSQSYAPKVDDLTRELLDQQIEQLEKQIKKLEHSLASFSQSQFKHYFELLTSIKGIGKATASALIQATNAFQNFSQHKPFAKFIGVAPSHYQSGTSVKLPASINRSGDPAIRSLLYNCAVTAKRFNRDCKELYERKRAEGKPYKVAIIAVVNKLLRQVFAIVQSGRKYQEDFAHKLRLRYQN